MFFVSKKKLFVLIVSLAVLGTGLWILNQPRAQEDQIQDEAVQTLTLSFDFAPGDAKTFKDVEFVRGESLLEVTERVALGSALSFEAKDFGAMGKLVTRIGDKENGDGKAFWQFWVNGDYATVGASAYIVQSEDVIEWRFTGERE